MRIVTYYVAGQFAGHSYTKAAEMCKALGLNEKYIVVRFSRL